MSIAIPLFVAALSIGALVIVIYNFLSGRRFVRDFFTKTRLKRLSLETCEDHWVDNPNRSNIVVCLTTTPSRIGLLDNVLKTLLSQTCAPKIIRLHIPDYSIREECEYQVPPELEKLRGVEVVRCRDEGPATKLIPALRDLSADQPILVVDDDMLYPKNMIEVYRERSQAEPDQAHTMSGWIVPEDLTDRTTTLKRNVLGQPPVPLKCSRIRTPRQIDVFQGYASFLVRPRFFDLEELTDYTDAPEQAFYVDDVWLSGHCNVPKYVLVNRRYPFTYWHRAQYYSNTSLGRINRGKGGPEQRSNTIVLRYLRDRWMVSASRR